MIRDPSFVGREDELQLLRRFYEDALSGDASVCFVSGEPGAGKTALVEHFAGRIQDESPATVVAQGSCTAHIGVADPYLPFREILSQLSGDVGEDVEQGRIAEENASRLRRLAKASVRIFRETAPDLLDLFVPGGSILAQLGASVSPGARRRRASTADPAAQGSDGARGELGQEQIFEQFTNLLKRLAREQPLLLLIDDLHWADKASVALLFHLYRHLGEAPVLLVGTYRPVEVGLGRDGERHPLEPVLNEIKRYEGDVAVDLDADSEVNRRHFFEALLDLFPNRLDQEFRGALFRQTRGHPLFTLELLWHMQDEGYLRRDEDDRWTVDAARDWTHLPARVEGTIAERIAQLDPDLQDVLRVASVEGERFRAPVVARVLGLDERAVIRRLGSIVEKKHGIVLSAGLHRVGGKRMAKYRFAHSVFQTYLYASIEENERAYVHGEVGEALEEIYGDAASEIAPELARHFEMAAVPEKAVRYHAAAAESALDLFATAEAIRSFERALKQLESLPPGDDRDQIELGLQERLGSCLVASGRYGSPETRAAYERARALCERLKQQTDAPILRALSISAIVTGEMERAHALAEELMASAQLQRDPVWIVEGHYAMGATSFWLGRFAASRRHLEEGLARYRPELAGVHTSLYAQDPRVVCRCRLAWTLWHLGYLDRSVREVEGNVAFARELEHPHSLGYALVVSAYLCVDAGKLDTAEQMLDEVLALFDRRKLGFFWAHREQITRGWLQAVRGDATGIEHLRRSTNEYLQTGNFLLITQDLGRLAELHLKLGEIDEGLEALSRASAMVARTGERYYAAELHRLRGELLLSRNAQEAEAAFRQALEVARLQQARWLELRAAISAGRLRHDQGRTESARSLLLGVLDGFTEGALSHDVLEARALLEAWS